MPNHSKSPVPATLQSFSKVIHIFVSKNKVHSSTYYYVKLTI